MSCIVCNRDMGESAQHRECVLTLFKEKRIKGVQDWIRLSMKPKTIIKGRVIRRVELPTNEGTLNTGESPPRSRRLESPSEHRPSSAS